MTGLTDTSHGCTHQGSRRPPMCLCGQYAAFWTLPGGDCRTCGKPSHYYDPDGDGPESHPWCVGCRDRLMLTDDEVQP